MTGHRDIPDSWVIDGVEVLELGWSPYEGRWRNAGLHKPAAIALDRCRPLFAAWARRAGFGMRLEDLLASCYLQGFMDSHANTTPTSEPTP